VETQRRSLESSISAYHSTLGRDAEFSCRTNQDENIISLLGLFLRIPDAPRKVEHNTQDLDDLMKDWIFELLQWFILPGPGLRRV
jgi:hypothetical protein